MSLELRAGVNWPRVGGASQGEVAPKTTERRLRNNSGEREECSLREINRWEEPGERSRRKRVNTARGCARESFHVGERRTEALLCLQPRGCRQNTWQRGEEEEEDEDGRVSTLGEITVVGGVEEDQSSCKTEDLLSKSVVMEDQDNEDISEKTKA